MRQANILLSPINESKASSISKSKPAQANYTNINNTKNTYSNSKNRYSDLKFLSEKMLVELKSNKATLQDSVPYASVMDDSFYEEIYNKYLNLNDNVLTKPSKKQALIKSRKQFSSKQLLPATCKASKQSVSRSAYKSIDTTDDKETDKYSNVLLTTIANTMDKRENEYKKQLITDPTISYKGITYSNHNKRNDIFKNIINIPSREKVSNELNDNGTRDFRNEKAENLSGHNKYLKNLLRKNIEIFPRLDNPHAFTKIKKPNSKNMQINALVEAEICSDPLQVRTALPILSFEKLKNCVDFQAKTQEVSFVPKQKKKFLCCF